MSETKTIQWEKGDDGIVILTIDDPSQGANTMNRDYIESMGQIVDRLDAEKESVTGVIITSGKKTFFAGGDLNDLLAVTKEQSVEFAAGIREVKSQLRRLETLGVPVVAAVAGSALGGGLEITLATHHRIVVDDPKIQLGTPEVQLGLLPGGGGVVRTVRMLGLADALMQVLIQGKPLRPAKARE
ncbi:MAG: enoyl-CoA hydratase/isomerase family protein, partial [Solirubrobacterales bacterium]|nr:enoyl-CoA hydratase/isomerase family protein [Solirubrobacterales bacterium]